MVENVIQIKCGIEVNVVATVKVKKNIECAKKILFGMLIHVAVKMVNM